MMSLPGKVGSLLASRRVSPIILGGFALIYLGIAARSDEALVDLMGMVKRTPLLLVLLSLVPFNMMARGLAEVRKLFLRRKALRGEAAMALEGLFDEQVRVAGNGGGEDVQRWLASAGYRTATGKGVLSAWRGVSTFPARLLFLFAAAALFVGIILSLSGRETVRDALIAGEQLPQFIADGGSVAEVTLRERNWGGIFARDLAISVTRADGKSLQFGIFPPARMGSWFVYPRFLGVAPLVRFSAPDFQPGIDAYSILMIHPAGKEDALVIPNTPYRLMFSLADTPGADPYATGAFTFLVRVEKMGATPVTLTVPVGGQAKQEGYLLAIPEVKRMVLADFVHDAGVPLVWLSLVLFAVSLMFFIPARVLNPRREMLFLDRGGEHRAFSRADGRRRRHAGDFHEALDILAKSKG